MEPEEGDKAGQEQHPTPHPQPSPHLYPSTLKRKALPVVTWPSVCSFPHPFLGDPSLLSVPPGLPMVSRAGSCLYPALLNTRHGSDPVWMCSECQGPARPSSSCPCFVEPVTTMLVPAQLQAKSQTLSSLVLLLPQRSVLHASGSARHVPEAWNALIHSQPAFPVHCGPPGLDPMSSLPAWPNDAAARVAPGRHCPFSLARGSAVDGRGFGAYPREAPDSNSLPSSLSLLAAKPKAL